MQSEDLKTLSKVYRPRNVGRGRNCPSDDQFAAFIDGGLPVDEHEQLCTHFADCLYCRERLSLIGRASDAEEQVPIPELLLARAARMAPGTHKRKFSTYRWAAAASIVLAMALVLQYLPDGQPGAIVLTDPGEEAQITRSVSPAARNQPERLAVRSHDGAFHWNPVPGSLYYEVRIVSDEGNLLWQERTNDTRWALPEGLDPVPEKEYFVRLDAYLSESKSLNSGYIGFRVRGSR